MAQERQSAATRGPVALYVHIPFCCYNCAYCGAFKVSASEVTYDPFLQAVEREWALVREEEGLDEGVEISAIYVGGGSPSLFGALRLGRLLEILRGGITWHESIELTLESHPASLDGELGGSLRAAGFNRLQVRVESFRDEELAALVRGHTGAEASAAVQAVSAAGFPALGLELLYGIPGQNLDHWTATLKEALRLPCSHLVITRTTPRDEALPERLLRGRFGESPLDESLLAQYQAAARRLVEAGFEHYEIESFARPGSRSRYAELFWDRQRCYGLGPGAHSFDGAVRWRNAADLEIYLAQLLEVGQRPPRDRYRLSPENAGQEELWLGLRRSEGVTWERLAGFLGEQRIALLQRKARLLAAQGFLEFTTDRLRMEPQAYFVAESVVRELIRALGGEPS